MTVAYQEIYLILLAIIMQPKGGWTIVIMMIKLLCPCYNKYLTMQLKLLEKIIKANEKTEKITNKHANFDYIILHLNVSDS